ncbi:helix-turn-helix transcriptional regulator [Frigoribacterium faeni]|uniref:helix-turn-helix transcriptional regulator n=1 Tax=Frigoribacterium faeni TaxID=145483 RepID=UPI002413332B|nr:helix-turn-helix transcriptional regulator [Frigoribacterium faeni]
MGEIAKRVRAARDARAWSQNDLAERASVSRPSIARIEAGEDVSTATLAKVADALNLMLRLATAEELTEHE